MKARTYQLVFALCAFASTSACDSLVDRLVHRSEVIEVEGNSYRLKEAKERAAQKTASRRGKKSAA